MRGGVTVVVVVVCAFTVVVCVPLNEPALVVPATFDVFVVVVDEVVVPLVPEVPPLFDGVPPFGGGGGGDVNCAVDTACPMPTATVVKAATVCVLAACTGGGVVGTMVMIG